MDENLVDALTKKDVIVEGVKPTISHWSPSVCINPDTTQTDYSVSILNQDMEHLTRDLEARNDRVFIYFEGHHQLALIFGSHD